MCNMTAHACLRVESWDSRGKAGIEVTGRWITVKILLGVHAWPEPGDDYSAYVPLSPSSSTTWKWKEKRCMHGPWMRTHAGLQWQLTGWLIDWTQNDPSGMHACVDRCSWKQYYYIFGGACACMHAYRSTSSQPVVPRLPAILKRPGTTTTQETKKEEEKINQLDSSEYLICLFALHCIVHAQTKIQESGWLQ